MAEDRISELKKRIEELPKGYISRKVISGKEHLYLQWRDGSNIRSRYIKESEKESFIAAIEERKALQEELSVAEGRVEYKAAPRYYLKWGDDVVGEIRNDLCVQFVSPDLNQTVKEYVSETGIWSRDDLVDFLKDRIVSPYRRDIEQILARLGLSSYDVIDVALATHAVSAKDMFWISETADAHFSDAVTDVFDSVFSRREDLTGDSVDTPEGENVKRYGVYDGKYGIYKRRLSPLTTDIESEIAVYRLADLLGVPCCPCFRTDQDTVFSEFEYDFSKEFIIHFRHILKKQSSGDYLMDLISARPGYLKDLARMICLDFITRQDDRHLSNIAVKMSEEPRGSEETFYPLYDNGRSLFYEDTEETAASAADDVEKYATSFGPSGSYLDHVRILSDMGISFGRLIDLDIDTKKIEEVLTDSGLTGYRLEGSIKWIAACLDILKSLDKDKP